jgi:hypothetical protein
VAIAASLDLTLPRGEHITIDGALCAAGLVVLGPAAGLAVALVGRSLAYVLRPQYGVDEYARLSVRRFFGVAAAIAALVLLDELLGDPPVFASAVAASVALLATEFLIAQLQSARGLGRTYGSLVVGNARTLGPLLFAEASAGVLAAIVFADMNLWSLALMLLLLILIRQSYAMLFEIREAYESTVAVLVETAEAQGASRVGHAERSAQIARAIAVSMGIRGRELERIGYAALLHDIDLVGVDTAEAAGELVRTSGQVVEGVEFLEDVVPVLRLCDGAADSLTTATEADLLAAYVVALSSDVDLIAGGDTADPDGVLATRRIATLVPGRLKGRVVGTAVAMGMHVPSVA